MINSVNVVNSNSQAQNTGYSCTFGKKPKVVYLDGEYVCYGQNEYANNEPRKSRCFEKNPVVNLDGEYVCYVQDEFATEPRKSRRNGQGLGRLRTLFSKFVK